MQMIFIFDDYSYSHLSRVVNIKLFLILCFFFFPFIILFFSLKDQCVTVFEILEYVRNYIFVD